MSSSFPPPRTKLLLTSRPCRPESRRAIIVHDMNNKINAVLTSLYFYEEDVETTQFGFKKTEINKVRREIKPLLNLVREEVHLGQLQNYPVDLRARLRDLLLRLPRFNAKELEDCYKDIAGAIREFNELAEEGQRLSEIQPVQEDVKLGDISQFVSKIVHSYQSRYPSIRFRLAVDGVYLTPFCASQIKRALENLLNNAVQSMGEETGEITVNLAISSYSADEKPFTQIEEGTYVRIEIRDNGPGIPQDVMKRLSEAYFTTKRDGSGLGLLSASNSIAKHKGHLFIESALGHGTKVTALIPSLPPLPII